MAEQEKSAFATVCEFVKTIDFDSLIEIAEMVKDFIPPFGAIIVSALKFAKKFQPAAGKLLTNADQLYGVATTQTAMQSSNPQIDEKQAKILALLEIACEDGVVTDEEEQFILSRAETLGLDTESIKLKLLRFKTQ